MKIKISLKGLSMMFAVMALTIISVFAQGTPSDVRDLIGVRASSGESALRNRGYSFIKTEEGDDRKRANWWKQSSRTCITVTTSNGRYNSITTAQPVDCNRNSGGGGGGGNVNVPNWAVGTFYGSGPSGERITLTINNNGDVTSDVNGSYNYGRLNRNNVLEMGGNRARVTRQGNGIVTTSVDDGARIVYSKNAWGGGNDNDNGNNNGNVPNWAVGTFYGSGPSGERITLTINNNGDVTSDVNGSYNYGRINRNNVLEMGGNRARVTREGNGIVTTSVDDGARIVYSKDTWGGGGGGGNDFVNVNDLIGARASSGESELRNRGFRNVDSSRSGNTSYLIWWRQRSRQCIEVSVSNGRYNAVNDIGSHSKCR